MKLLTKASKLSTRKYARQILAGLASHFVGAITHVSTQESVVALTFDDGPSPDFTPRLLEILNHHQAHATFFMVGESAQQHPKLVQQIAEAGHAIGNHSWDHSSFPLLGSLERRQQLQACEQAIAPYSQRLFRPPYGHENIASRLEAILLGYQVIKWNAIAMDWLDHDPEWMLQKLLKETQPGSIILFHDHLHRCLEPRYRDRSLTLTTVSLLLDRLSSYRFVTVPELLKYGHPQRTNFYRQPDIKFLEQLV